MKFEKGFKFIESIYDYEIIEYIQEEQKYRLKNLNTGADNELMTEEDIDLLVEFVDLELRKRRIYYKSINGSEQREKEQQEAELKAKQEYELCFGYTDKMTAMQKGKVLKTLNKKFRYDGKVMTRKQYVVEQIKVGKQLENDDKIGCRFEWKELNHNNRYSTLYVEITKTEYDFAKYLIDNNIVIPEAEAV